MENRQVCCCSTRWGIVFTQLMCLIRVDDSVTNGKSKNKRTKVKLWHACILQNSYSLYFDSSIATPFSQCLLYLYSFIALPHLDYKLWRQKINNPEPMWRCFKTVNKKSIRSDDQTPFCHLATIRQWGHTKTNFSTGFVTIYYTFDFLESEDSSLFYNPHNSMIVISPK